MNKEEKEKLRLEFVETLKLCIKNEVFDGSNESLLVIHSKEISEKIIELTCGLVGNSKRLSKNISKLLSDNSDFKDIVVEALLQDMESLMSHKDSEFLNDEDEDEDNEIIN